MFMLAREIFRDLTPSPGKGSRRFIGGNPAPGEGWGGGLQEVLQSTPTPPLSRSRSTGGRTGGTVPRSRAGFVLLTILACGLCLAQEPTTLPSEPSELTNEISRQLADLASPEAEVRESARVRLMQLRREDLPAFARQVDAARPLAPAQTVALRQIVQEIYLSGEDYDKEPGHAFLGIMGGGPDYRAQADVGQPNDGSHPIGVVVFDRIPGFCAARRLLDGDIILGTTDPAQPFTSFDELKQTIGVVAPGATVHLRVLRRGKLIDVPLTLDVKPVAAEPDAGWAFQELRDRRAAKFTDYWNRTFAPLLKPRQTATRKSDTKTSVTKSD